MSTWAGLLADIRTDLKDTGTTPKWTDEMLYVWLKDAVRDYTLNFPLESNATLTESSGAYALPSDFYEDVYVECPADRYVERRIAQPGVKYKTLSARPTLYWIRQGNLYLNGSPGEDNVELYYLAKHGLPTGATDDTFVMTIPENDEELIRLFIKAKASEQYRTKQATLDRFRPGSGNRTDNPMDPEVDNLMDEYYRRVATRFPGGVIRLYRTGRRWR